MYIICHEYCFSIQQGKFVLPPQAPKQTLVKQEKQLFAILPVTLVLNCYAFRNVKMPRIDMKSFYSVLKATETSSFYDIYIHPKGAQESFF